MKNKILKFIGAVLFVGGLMSIIGSAGALDNGSITMLQTVVQAVIGLALIGVGYVAICLGANEEGNYER